MEGLQGYKLQESGRCKYLWLLASHYYPHWTAAASNLYAPGLLTFTLHGRLEGHNELCAELRRSSRGDGPPNPSCSSNVLGRWVTREGRHCKPDACRPRPATGWVWPESFRPQCRGGAGAGSSNQEYEKGQRDYRRMGFDPGDVHLILGCVRCGKRENGVGVHGWCLAACQRSFDPLQVRDKPKRPRGRHASLSQSPWLHYPCPGCCYKHGAN